VHFMPSLLSISGRAEGCRDNARPTHAVRLRSAHDPGQFGLGHRTRC